MLKHDDHQKKTCKEFRYLIVNEFYRINSETRYI